MLPCRNSTLATKNTSTSLKFFHLQANEEILTHTSRRRACTTGLRGSEKPTTTMPKQAKHWLHGALLLDFAVQQLPSVFELVSGLVLHEGVHISVSIAGLNFQRGESESYCRVEMTVSIFQKGHTNVTAHCWHVTLYPVVLQSGPHC